MTIGWNGLEIQFVTKLEPPGSGVDRLPGGVVIPANDYGRVHRSITDAAHHRSFGYDLVLESLPDPQTLRLRIEPPGLPGNPGETLLAPPKLPLIPVVHIGDTVALDLLVNPTNGQKIVDYLSVRRSKPARLSEAPHDFAIPDVELTLESPLAWVNGKLVEASAKGPGGAVAAHVLYIAVPGDGLFEFSLWPEPGLGFQKAGVVNGKTITFRVGSAEYRVESAVSIAPGSGLYNVYVLHKPAPRDLYTFGGSDKAGMIHIQ